ncbi:endoribonuclease L-PSP [Ktedonobacter robiniae]|uniref:Endoribonuclease L-PSP n=2 Tax=Ktedonobacter robiniae TaxID=2778365 RepID=A0ABQ3V196_9CHLR|nr:endoribonuclease L-PSP [Ktedonobacter robiniae]
MNREGLNSSEIEAPVGPFSHVVRAGDLLYISGQTGQRSHTGTPIGNDIAEQTTQIFENLKAVLRTVNCDLSHIVKVTVFLTNIDDFAAMNAVYAHYFDLPYPARSTIAVKALPLGALVEVECIAKVEDENTSDGSERPSL